MQKALLGHVFTTFDQSGSFKNPLDNHFAPIPLFFGVTLDRLSKQIGIVTHLPAQLLQLAHLLDKTS